MSVHVKHLLDVAARSSLAAVAAVVLLAATAAPAEAELRVGAVNAGPAGTPLVVLRRPGTPGWTPLRPDMVLTTGDTIDGPAGSRGLVLTGPPAPGAAGTSTFTYVPPFLLLVIGDGGEDPVIQMDLLDGAVVVQADGPTQIGAGEVLAGSRATTYSVTIRGGPGRLSVETVVLDGTVALSSASRGAESADMELHAGEKASAPLRQVKTVSVQPLAITRQEVGSDDLRMVARARAWSDVTLMRQRMTFQDAATIDRLTASYVRMYEAPDGTAQRADQRARLFREMFDAGVDRGALIHQAKRLPAQGVSPTTRVIGQLGREALGLSPATRITDDDAHVLSEPGIDLSPGFKAWLVRSGGDSPEGRQPEPRRLSSRRLLAAALALPPEEQGAAASRAFALWDATSLEIPVPDVTAGFSAAYSGRSYPQTQAPAREWLRRVAEVAPDLRDALANGWRLRIDTRGSDPRDMLGLAEVYSERSPVEAAAWAASALNADRRSRVLTPDEVERARSIIRRTIR